MALSPRRRAAVTVQVFRGIELPVQFVLAAIVANLLGPENFGLAGVLLSVQAVVLVLAGMGMDEILQRTIASDASSLTSAFARALKVRLLTASGVVVVAIIASVVISYTSLQKELGTAIWWSTVYIIATLLSGPVLSASLSTYRVPVALTASLVSWLTPLALALLGLIDDVGGYAFALALGAALKLVISTAWAIRMRWVSYSGLRERSPALDTLANHVSVVVYGLNNQILARHGDVLVASIVGLSLTAIGIYSLSFQIAVTANTFLMLGIGAIGLSRLSEHAHDRPLLGAAWAKLSRASSIIAFGPLSVLALVAPELVAIFFHASYSGMTPVLLALIAAQWVNRICGSGTNMGALLALGESKYVARSSLTGGGLNIALSFALAPFLGVYGLALATASSVAAVGIANATKIRRMTGARQPWALIVSLSVVVVASIALTLFGASALVRWVAGALIGIVWAIIVLKVVRK